LEREQLASILLIKKKEEKNEMILAKRKELRIGDNESEPMWSKSDVPTSERLMVIFECLKDWLQKQPSKAQEQVKVER
jgi:hypothetical protein